MTFHLIYKTFLYYFPHFFIKKLYSQVYGGLIFHLDQGKPKGISFHDNLILLMEFLLSFSIKFHARYITFIFFITYSYIFSITWKNRYKFRNFAL